MSLIDVETLTFGYTEEDLYKDASMRLFQGDHAVLVGRNGSGKSTFLKLLNGDLKPDSGNITVAPRVHVGYLDQYASLDERMSVGTYLYDAFSELFDMESRMESLYEAVQTAPARKRDKILAQAADLGDILVESGFYGVKSDIGKILGGMGLSTDIMAWPIGRLSGGMRAKIILCKLLLMEPDVLLLDEPTNFLDAVHIEWLMKYLASYPKTFLLVSHHETLLDAVATTVFSIENQEIIRYKGSFKNYLEQRALRHEQHVKAHAAQQKLIERTEVFIAKNIARATTTKRAQSRRKMLQKMKKLSSPKKERTYAFHFPFGKTTGRDVLHVDCLEVGYDAPLIEPLTFTIMKEEKVVITGENGIGKSTLVKTLTGRMKSISGTYAWIDTAMIAYFEQESSLPDAATAFDIVHDHYPNFTRRDVLSLLASHGIDAEQTRQPFKTLSGGEQTKIRLALLRHQKGNVLILDEPTNHLDIRAKEALQQALIDYRGTLILVSHDRDFYAAVCDYEISLF